MVIRKCMNSRKKWCLRYLAGFSVVLSFGAGSAVGQENQVWNTDTSTVSRAMPARKSLPSRAEFVPIGTRSLVDQYRHDRGRKPEYAPTANRTLNPARYSVRMQQGGFAAPPLPTAENPAMALPSGDGMGFPMQPPTPEADFQQPAAVAPFSTPPASAQPAAPDKPVSLPNSAVPSTGPPPALPVNPPISAGPPVSSLPATQSMPGRADLLPIAPPQLDVGFATVGNSCCVSPPSNYVAAMGLGNCSSGGYQATPSQNYLATGPRTATPSQNASVAPSGLTPVTTPTARGVPKRPVINLGQNRNAVVVGQGLIGQPVAYVPAQCFRNWIRYIFP